MSLVLESQADLDTMYASVAADFNSINYGPFLEETLDKLEDRHSIYFDAETGPGNNTWPALAQSTIDRKGHDTILVDTGRLKASLVGTTGDSLREVIAEGSNAGLSYGTAVPYSIFHDSEGGRLPYRPHVGLDEADVDGITEQLADYVLEDLENA